MLMTEIEFDKLLAQFSNIIFLKKGGQKEVFIAEHLSFGRVVIKLGRDSSGNSIERIKREVDALKDINSPFFPKNFRFEITENRFVIVEEYIESTPLSQCLTDFSDPSKALKLFESIVLGLCILWNKRVVHRDIKPDNLLISQSGNPVIIDLGIARFLDLTSLTNPLALRGPATPLYAAPEQLWNRKSQIDHRTDQFCLGILLLQILLKDVHPFDPKITGCGSSTIDNILNDRWYRDSLIDTSLKPFAHLINTLLGHEPYQRYRTSQLLLNEIRGVLL